MPGGIFAIVLGGAHRREPLGYLAHSPDASETIRRQPPPVERLPSAGRERLRRNGWCAGLAVGMVPADPGVAGVLALLILFASWRLPSEAAGAFVGAMLREFDPRKRRWSAHCLGGPPASPDQAIDGPAARQTVLHARVGLTAIEPQAMCHATFDRSCGNGLESSRRTWTSNRAGIHASDHESSTGTTDCGSNKSTFA